MMIKVRKKSALVEAEQFFVHKKPWPEGVEQLVEGFVVETLTYFAEINEGDWVVSVDKGNRFPCSPEFFEMTYELVGGMMENNRKLKRTRIIRGHIPVKASVSFRDAAIGWREGEFEDCFAKEFEALCDKLEGLIKERLGF